MSERRPLQPLSPLAGNVVGAKYNYTTKVDNDFDELSELDGQGQDDNTQGSGSIVSGLTSLENDADDFERLMIQNARDERRLNNALHGKVQPFRKARTHPRVALTMDNLERNEAGNNGALHAKAHIQFESPPSSGGSTRSDPAVQPPAGWGRKGRVRRDWLRTITSDDEQKPGAQEDTINRLVEEESRTPRRADGAAYMDDVDMPIPSIEDSPLSRKSSLAGTPSSTRRREAQLDRIQDWDFTMDLNEASLIASTPYVPRNTALEDIRHREIESLREQAVTTSRLDKIRERSPEETRRPRSSSAHSTHTQTNGATSIEQPAPGTNTSEVRLRKRTNSWKTMGKSQAVTGERVNQVANSPVLVYSKSSETVGVINRDLVANAPTSPKRPTHRREDSHDLLRRLARVSSVTPSPARNSDPRPQTAPARQPGSSSQTPISETSLFSAKDAHSLEKSALESTSADTIVTAPNTQLQQDQHTEKRQPQVSAPTQTQEQETVDMDATPMPIERSMLNAKTPVVTGAWIDTPAPRTSHRSAEPSRSPSRSPKKGSPSKRPLQKQPVVQPEEAAEIAPMQVNRPTLPGSALEAIVEEARAGGRRHRPDDFGDSTINSLEDIIGPSGGAENIEIGDPDEDTLQGLQVPTGIPRNEAERQRQQELLHLHSMNLRLRAARTSIRDASRGMKRVEDRVEHAEGGTGVEQEGVRIIYRDCPCAHNGHQCDPWGAAWSGFKGLFRDPKKNKLRGLTWLSIFLISFLVWFISESVACEFECHHLYAHTMVGYGVKYDAPIYPFVLPTLFYRNFIRAWWRPLWGFLAWIYHTTYDYYWDDTVVKTATQTATMAARQFTRTVVGQQETFEAAGSMYDDEII